MTVEIRQATSADWDAISAFLADNYGGVARYKASDRWDWQFAGNPFRTDPLSDAAPVWIAVDQGQVVGQIAVQCTDIKIGDGVHPGGWIVDVMISPSHRGRGLGHQLYSAAQAGIPILLTLTMAPATRRMAERLGAVTLAPTLQFTKWRTITSQDVRRYLTARLEDRPALQRFATFGSRLFGVAELLGITLTSFASIQSFARPKEVTDLTFSEVERFGPETDALWKVLDQDYPAICPRTTAFLNWRFVDCPVLRYQRFLVRRGGDVVGCLVLRRTEEVELREGIIVEALASRNDAGALQAMVAFAVRFFDGQVASVECGSSIPELERVLRGQGFFVTRRHRPTVVVSDEGLRADAERLHQDWYFSKGDHDWDQVHPA